MMAGFIVLPFPVSTNSLYFNVPKRGRVKTARYKQWIAEADTMLMKQILKRFTVRVDLDIRCGGGRKNQDISNLIKCVEDALVRNGILVDDKKEFVRSVKVSWDDETVGCSVTIEGV